MVGAKALWLAVIVALTPCSALADTLEEQLAASAAKYDEPWYDQLEVFDMFVCEDLPAEYYKRQIAVASAVLSWVPTWAPALLELIQAQIQLGQLDQATKAIQQLEQSFERTGATERLWHAVLSRRGQLEQALKPGNHGGFDGQRMFVAIRLEEYLKTVKKGVAPAQGFWALALTGAQRSEEVFKESLEGNYDPLYDDFAWMSEVFGKPVRGYLYFGIAEQLVHDKRPLLAVMAYEKAREHGHPVDHLPGYAALRRRVEQSGQLKRAQAALAASRSELLARPRDPNKVDRCKRWHSPSHEWWISREETAEPQREAFVAGVEGIAKLYDEHRSRCDELPRIADEYRRKHAAELTVSYAVVYTTAQRERRDRQLRFYKAIGRIAEVAEACARTAKL